MLPAALTADSAPTSLAIKAAIQPEREILIDSPMPRFPTQWLVNLDRYIHHCTFARLHGSSKRYEVSRRVFVRSTLFGGTCQFGQDQQAFGQIVRGIHDEDEYRQKCLAITAAKTSEPAAKHDRTEEEGRLIICCVEGFP